MIALLRKLYGWLIAVGNALRSPVLLAIRLFWGWQFFLTGKGKLMDLSKPTQYFESLHIPLPHLNAILRRLHGMFRRPSSCSSASPRG